MLSKTKASAKNKNVIVKKGAKKTSIKDASVSKKTASKKNNSKPTNEIKKSTLKKEIVSKKAVSKKISTTKPENQKQLKIVANPSVKKNMDKKTEKKSSVNKAATKVPTKTKVEKAIKPKSKSQDIDTKNVVVAKKEKVSSPKKTIVAPTTYAASNNSVGSKSPKEPVGKFEMEFVIRASEDMVFEFVSTESGLSEWFCDDVNIKNNIFTFNWDGQVQQARLIKEVPPVFIRYQWLDKEDGSYFEFKIEKDELTNDVSLIITDFASDKNEEISSKLLWQSQVDKLLHVLGSFF